MAAEGQPDTHAQAGRRVGKGTGRIIRGLFQQIKNSLELFVAHRAA
jgi:hypothetical protein